jgi:ketosteroid isomerase-like protein
MSQENVRLVQESFEAFRSGDAEKMAELLHPEAEFHGTVGGLQEGEVARSQAEFDENFEAQDLEAWEERRFEAEEFIDAGDNVVILMREFRRGRVSGVELEARTAAVVAVKDGRVIRFQGYLDRGEALEAAGLPK